MALPRWNGEVSTLRPTSDDAPTVCTVLVGTAATVQHAVRALPPRQVTLAHVRRRQHARDGSRSALSSFLVTAPSARLPVSYDSPALAVAAPASRVGIPSRAPALIELPGTPLVRASRSMLRSLRRERMLPQHADPEGVEHVLLSLLRAVVHEHVRPEPADERSVAALLETFIDEHHRDPLLDVDTIARELHFSRRQLYRFARGEGVAAMLAERRVTTACELLRERPELSISDIALMSGFASASRLRVHIMRRHGVTPTEYRDGLTAGARRDLSPA